MGVLTTGMMCDDTMQVATTWGCSCSMAELAVDGEPLSLTAAHRQEVFPEEEAAHPSGSHNQGLGGTGQESHGSNVHVSDRGHLPEHQASRSVCRQCAIRMSSVRAHDGSSA